MVTFKLVFPLTHTIDRWNVGCENEQEIDSSIYKRLQTLQIGLIQNENLNKYVNSSHYWRNDNDAFIQCTKDLKIIQEAFNE